MQLLKPVSKPSITSCTGEAPLGRPDQSRLNDGAVQVFAEKSEQEVQDEDGERPNAIYVHRARLMTALVVNNPKAPGALDPIRRGGHSVDVTQGRGISQQKARPPTRQTYICVTTITSLSLHWSHSKVCRLARGLVP